MKKRKSGRIITHDDPYDLSVVTVQKKHKRKYKHDISPYDLSGIDMEERREWFARNRSKI